MQPSVPEDLSAPAIAVGDPVPVAASGASAKIFVFYDHQRFKLVAERVSDTRCFLGMDVGPAEGVPLPAFRGYRIDAVGRACVAKIRAQQPAGPYMLGGFSFGGRIALEVARQLRAAGETVTRLIVLETFMPGAHRRRPIKWFVHHVRGVLTQGPRYLTAARKVDAPVGVPAEIDPSGERTQQVQRQWHFRKALSEGYVPPRYDGEIVLYRATQNEVAPHYRIDRLLGWGRIAAGPLEVHDVPASHLDVMDGQRAPAVAQTMVRYLR